MTTRADLEVQAKALYAALQTSKPSWDQLRDGTREVWIGFARNGQTVNDWLPSADRTDLDFLKGEPKTQPTKSKPKK